MKLHLLVKMILMLMLVFVGFHLVSMPYSSHPVSHGKMVAVEAEASSATINLQVDDQKHFHLLNSIQVNGLQILVLAITSQLFFSTRKSRRKIKHFLYSVYYQSSYFSRNHLFTA